jgi:NADH:ubiquinone oxidoreductase subunit E
MATAQLSLDAAEQAFIDQVIVDKSGRPGELLGILEAAQERNPNKYLSPDTLRYIAAQLDIPLSRIYSVATFYALFNLEPQGDNTICICRATRVPCWRACAWSWGWWTGKTRTTQTS